MMMTTASSMFPYTSMDVLQDTHYLGGIWLDSEGLDHDKLTKTIRESLALAHSFKPTDERAVFIFDAAKQLAQFNIISMGLKVLLAFIGTITLGIGGVGSDEHHAGLRHPAHAGNWGRESARRPQAETSCFSFSPKPW